MEVQAPDPLAGLQQPPAQRAGDAPVFAPLLIDAEHRAIETPEAWVRRRDELAARWRAYLGELRGPRNVPRVEVIEEDRAADGGVIRQHIRYDSEPGDAVEAYLLRPAEPAARKRPGIAVFHSTVDYTIRQPAGLEGPDDKYIGLHLARRGYVALCPRNFLWAQPQPDRLEDAVARHQERHPGTTGMAKMLFDAVRAVDLLQAQPDVDGERLGAIGHSLGAKEVLYLAAFDPRVHATVSSEGGIGLDFSNWEAPWYLGEAIRRPGFGLDHAQLLALVAPRAFLLLAGESADGDRSWPYIEAALPVWRLTGAPEAVGWINHRQGHEFPAKAVERAYAWLDHFLKAP